MTAAREAEFSADSAQAGAAAPGPFGFPIMLEIRGRRAFVAGGGREPGHKAAVLAELGASVVVWAPEHVETAALAAQPGVVLLGDKFRPELLEGALIAVVGTGDRKLDRAIATEARSRGVLVNTVDDIPYCDWSYPAVLRRGDLTVSFATAGLAPALAVRLRDDLAERVGPEYGELLALFGAVRGRIIASGRSFASRRRLWYELVDGPALDQIRAGRPDLARGAIETAIGAWEAAQ